MAVGGGHMDTAIAQLVHLLPTSVTLKLHTDRSPSPVASATAIVAMEFDDEGNHGDRRSHARVRGDNTTDTASSIASVTVPWPWMAQVMSAPLYAT